ncbi:hypothetical protein ACWEP2_29505 [Streptomyces sp. NPDC004279]
MSGAPEHFAAIEADWRPGPVEAAEFVTAAPVRALAGLFDQPVPALGVGDPLPPLWHWLYVLDRPAQADLGEDAHPRDGGLFLPPLPDRRRMFGWPCPCWNSRAAAPRNAPSPPSRSAREPRSSRRGTSR